MRLASKITFPFVALFALLLCILGFVLAREIISDVESSVENEQRFVLEVATFPGFALGEDSLRQIRDRAQGVDNADSAAHGDFVVLEENAAPITTFQKDDAAGQKTAEALIAAAKSNPALQSHDDGIRRERLDLNGESFLLLHTTRAAKAFKAQPRHFFLLYPYAEIGRAQNRAILRIVALGGLGLLLAAALGMLIAHWISAPVRKLASAAKRISAGGLDEPVEWNLSSAQDEIGELHRAFQAMVENLKASQRELLKSERLAATGKIAAGVAHEIRNPLTSLRMTIEMLQMRANDPAKVPAQVPDEKALEAYKIVLSEIDRLALAVDELLSFARPQPLKREAMNLNTLAADTIAFLDRQFAHAKVGVKTEFAAQMPEVALDAHKIRQVLVNLLLNAQQAIVRDGCIVVGTAWDAAKKEASFSVSDNGPGIAEEIRGTLFELFSSTKPGGCGLGLAIAKQLIEEHGGRIRYETSAKGTIFTVTLPA